MRQKLTFPKVSLTQNRRPWFTACIVSSLETLLTAIERVTEMPQLELKMNRPEV
jgi:hypothetical protein